MDFCLFLGLTDSTAKELARFLEFKGGLIDKAAQQLKNLWHLFVNVDAVQV